MNIFEQAVRQQLRLEINGLISIEQLYSAKASKAFLSQVADYEASLAQELDQLGKTGRRQAQKTEKRKTLELKLAVVSFYLDEQESLEQAAVQAAETKAKKQELLELIAAKQKEQTASKSLDELKAELALLG